MLTTYKTTSGHSITYDRTPELDAFLRRLENIVEDPRATGSDAIAYAYSLENPILDRTMFPKHGAVTRQVLRNPVYRVVTDLVFRKQVVLSEAELSRMAARHSMSVPEAAAELAITEEALRIAIDEWRIGTWLKNGEHFLDPHSVATARSFRLFATPAERSR